MQISLTKERFLELADQYSVVPLATEVLGDRETPVSVFEALVGDDDGFLLESVEGGERWARWSFVGWDPVFTLVARNGVTEAVGADIDLPDGDPLQVLESLLARFRTPDGPECGFPGAIPPLHGGFVGYLAYDVVRYVEALPEAPLDDRGLPEMVWHVGGGLAAIDRLRDTILIIRNVVIGDDPARAYDEALQSIEGDVERLSRVSARSLGTRPLFDEVAAAVANTSQEHYEAGVRLAI
ncbi:MAG: anthranilate synthase component I, partial [Acidimicrobiia bacterium]